MKRRDFLMSATGVAAGIGLSSYPASALSVPEGDQICKEASFPKVLKLTAQVVDFVINTQLSEIPPETIELGKKSILDGLGLALSGSKAETAPLIQQYIGSLGCQSGGAIVLGSATKLPARFAALANGIAIHVDDFDDTQLAVGKDRVYGLLVHPTVCVLPAALAMAEVGGRSGKDLLLAYQLGVEV